MELQVQLLTVSARAPARATEGSAGYDLFSDQTFVLAPHSRQACSTGVALAIPAGYYGQIGMCISYPEKKLASRSSMALRRSIDVGAGVLDSDYRGEVKVLLVNNGEEPYEVRLGDRIAQLLLLAHAIPPVAIVNQLDATARGAGGFGSTGK